VGRYEAGNPVHRLQLICTPSQIRQLRVHKPQKVSRQTAKGVGMSWSIARSVLSERNSSIIRALCLSHPNEASIITNNIL
jgi:hypothetical protein